MSAPVFQARGLRVALHGREVLRGVDVSVQPGRWLAIVGPNGAGKSTLLQALAGLLPVQGALHFTCRPLDQWTRRERALQMAWMGQGQDVPADLCVHDLVMLGRLPHQGWQARASQADAQAVRQALEAVDLWALRDRPLGFLSGGERQRVLLARALAVQAPVMLMDEPLANLDAPHQAQWWAQVRQHTLAGGTVLSVLHELSMALQADELLVLHQGQVIHQGAPDDAATRAALASVFGPHLAIARVQSQWVALPRRPQ